ncbi:Universal stress protein, UspA [Rhodovulum sp. PH10]|uniref:universal stress protein n=1 Tax=Rhodovulum sp. PH10 TaxID=1187851 RepID=UPI00027C2158|nr:universal stress protein [Rhodovulum sp. PH10]EJW13561.1 Universal stress protein, UspA [Rhodovulum sp. PH10]
MSYATVMVHVGADEGSDARVRLAASLGERFHSTLIGVTGQAPAPIYANEGMVLDLGPTEDETMTVTAELGRLGEHFRNLVGPTNRRVEWRASPDHPIEVVARAARAADLIVIGTDPAPTDPFRALDPGSVILRAGRPVLVVPRGLGVLDPTRVMIAWKDTREARRALVDALPFLHEAERVMVVEVCDAGMEDIAQDDIDDVERHLARHRISTGAGIVVQGASSTAGELIRIAREERIDLIVAGGYGHSRLGEWIFGGVTRGLIADSPICSLLSH